MDPTDTHTTTCVILLVKEEDAESSSIVDVTRSVAVVFVVVADFCEMRFLDREILA